jgi:hypothetical protein
MEAVQAVADAGGGRMPFEPKNSWQQKKPLAWSFASDWILSLFFTGVATFLLLFI